MTQNIYGNVNGSVIGTNSGVVNNNFDIVKEFNPELAGLLNTLTQDQLTKKEAEALIKDIAEIKNVDENKKESLLDKIFKSAERLVTLAEATATLSPIAVQAYELIKNLIN